MIILWKFDGDTFMVLIMLQKPRVPAVLLPPPASDPGPRVFTPRGGTVDPGASTPPGPARPRGCAQRPTGPVLVSRFAGLRVR
jgi:hypothetical protein